MPNLAYSPILALLCRDLLRFLLQAICRIIWSNGRAPSVHRDRFLRVVQRTKPQLRAEERRHANMGAIGSPAQFRVRFRSLSKVNRSGSQNASKNAAAAAEKTE